ncbi:hypothetical protein MsAg5_13480 [Methanosarcinaceae archaeon Ag5]|uniref:Uncharacterized protein n=1 Tax=Methanolapillus africanus TaxID=3028297 RepID=A0AAE4MLW9_9EURY|nr:hypothetical protein [Methanosarcinaceae archaeon Ag5]
MAIDEAHYKKWLTLDSAVIIVMWLALVISETYVAYYILHSVISQGLELPIALIGVYVLFLLLMFTINGLGCYKVWVSIKEHMYEMEYYG